MAKKLTKVGLKKRLKTMDQKDLSELVLELYSECPIVKERLSFLYLGEEYAKEELEKRKKLLYKTFFARSFSLEKLETILKDFKAICKDTYWYGELALYFAILTTDLIGPEVIYNKKYFTALTKAFDEVTRIASQDKRWFEQWRNDIDYIMDRYAEYSEDMYGVLIEDYYSIPWLDDEVYE